MKQAGVPINDSEQVESGGKEKLMGGDGTHYTQEGYEVLAVAVTDSILRSLAQYGMYQIPVATTSQCCINSYP